MSLRLWDYRPSGRRVPGCLLSLMFRLPHPIPSVRKKPTYPPPSTGTLTSINLFRTDSQCPSLIG
ncbi:hypothetical protein D9C73_018847 [Collichthys lucidus]|uniref:Uncharacterized protein n=1 Tax=Collichthys lucidus TaxID=240159 RepID=A0A4U5VBZ8_COLLU|nr:hypothetical protein D9C73_018847 [Collichthys lucidus]